MNPRIYIAIIGTLLVLLVCFFTARVLIYGFNLGNHQARGVMSGFIMSGLLYIGSFFSVRTANRIGKRYYQVANIMAGIIFHLFLGAIVLGLISVGYIIAGATVPLDIVWSIVALSLIAALAAFIQAKRIVVTQYEVTLPNAPESWHGKTAAVVSDTHFGLINYTAFAEKVVQKILSLQPDFVLHAGDFYDGPTVPTEPITAIWKKLTDQVPLFYTPGNHEAYGDYSAFVQSVRDAGATVLDDKVTEYEGVQIAGTLYRSGKEPVAIAEVLRTLDLDKDKPTILINHPPTAFTAPLEHGVNLIVSGHTHQGQTWPFRHITRRIYGEYDYGLSSYKDLVSITSDGIGTYGPPVRLLNSPEIVLITFVLQRVRDSNP